MVWLLLGYGITAKIIIARSSKVVKGIPVLGQYLKTSYKSLMVI
jgi:hypothetical protein